MSGVSQETQERDEDNMIHLLDEDSMKYWVEFWSEESDNEVGQRIENWISVLLGVKEVDVERANIWKCGMRWAVEARRKERGGEQEQNTGQEQGKQGKHVRFGQGEQQEETKAENRDEPEVTSRLADTITGRGMTGLVREGDERYRADETSRKGKGKGNGGKAEHEGKGGGVGKKGTQQIEKLVMDEVQENHREDVRKLVEMMQKEEERLEKQRGRVAPNTPRPCRSQKGKRSEG